MWLSARLQTPLYRALYWGLGRNTCRPVPWATPGKHPMRGKTVLIGRMILICGACTFSGRWKESVSFSGNGGWKGITDRKFHSWHLLWKIDPSNTYLSHSFYWPPFYKFYRKTSLNSFFKSILPILWIFTAMLILILLILRPQGLKLNFWSYGPEFFFFRFTMKFNFFK